MQDASGEFVHYDEYMTRVYVADPLPEERSALRLVLVDLHLEVIGEAADWESALAQAPSLRPDMLLIDWSMLPLGVQSEALAGMREACPGALVIVLISHLDARQQAALSAGADTFISKGETPERVAERLRAVAASISI
jgi:DNA-binding NarL/FixJ family response regulator